MTTMIDFEALSQERKRMQAEGRIPAWYTTQAWQMFKANYLVESEGDVRSRFNTLAYTLSRHLPSPYKTIYYKKFFDDMWEGILSPSSPVLANTGTTRGDIVSCSGQVIGDSVLQFYGSLTETAILSKRAYGTSGYFGKVRPRGSKFANNGKANGQYAVIEDFFTCADKISQGGMRKGSFAAYVDLDSPDFYECLWAMKKKPKGKNFGWVIKDQVIQLLINGDAEMSKRWQDALHVKLLTGKGYLFFPDKANRHRPQMYIDLGLDIVATNLCSEIMLHSSEDLTYSCVLASLNAMHLKKILSGDHVKTALIFLDCVISEYLEKSKGVIGLEKIRAFTEKGRAVGLGYLGFHTYLQAERIPYDSLEAHQLNYQMYKHLHDQSLEGSQWLAKLLGEPEWCKGYGVRNTHRTAQAPNKSTANLMGGVSEAIQADPGMVFTSASAAGELDRIVPEFYKLMLERGQYTKENIASIVSKLGSVQHLDWLTDHEKAVFKNAFEIDPRITLRMAESRQKWLCQGQSLNFYLREESAEETLSYLMSACALSPWILSVYYAYTRSGVVVTDQCVSCAA